MSEHFKEYIDNTEYYVVHFPDLKEWHVGISRNNTCDEMSEHELRTLVKVLNKAKRGRLYKELKSDRY